MPAPTPEPQSTYLTVYTHEHCPTRPLPLLLVLGLQCAYRLTLTTTQCALLLYGVSHTRVSAMGVLARGVRGRGPGSGARGGCGQLCHRRRRRRRRRGRCRRLCCHCCRRLLGIVAGRGASCLGERLFHHGCMAVKLLKVSGRRPQGRQTSW